MSWSTVGVGYSLPAPVCLEKFGIAPTPWEQWTDRLNGLLQASVELGMRGMI